MGQALSQSPTAKARRRLADGDAVEYLVVGAGPAGLQAAYFLKKFGLDHAVVDAADGPASFFRKYPVGRRLISINKRHLPDLAPLDEAERRAAQESEIPSFKGSYLGHFPLVSADFWTSDHLSERSRSVDAFFGTRARGKLTLKRR